MFKVHKEGREGGKKSRTPKLKDNDVIVVGRELGRLCHNSNYKNSSSTNNNDNKTSGNHKNRNNNYRLVQKDKQGKEAVAGVTIATVLAHPLTIGFFGLHQPVLLLQPRQQFNI